MPEHTLNFASESAKGLAAVYTPGSHSWDPWTAAGAILEPGFCRTRTPLAVLFPLMGRLVDVAVPTIPETITPGSVVTVAARFEGVLEWLSGGPGLSWEPAAFAWTRDANGVAVYVHTAWHSATHSVRGAACPDYPVQCSTWNGYGYVYPSTFTPDWDKSHLMNTTEYRLRAGDTLADVRGTTVQIGLAVDPWFVTGYPWPLEPVAVRMDYLRAHFRFTYQTADSPAPSTQGEPAQIVDTYHPLGVTCCIHANAKQEGASVRQVIVSIHRGPLARMGGGAGSKDGWETYNWGDVDARSRIGAFWRHDGALVLMFDEFPGGTRTARYSVNAKMGSGPRSNWSAPDSITPSEARAMAVGRSQGQVYRFFS